MAITKFGRRETLKAVLKAAGLAASGGLVGCVTPAVVNGFTSSRDVNFGGPLDSRFIDSLSEQGGSFRINRHYQSSIVLLTRYLMSQGAIDPKAAVMLDYRAHDPDDFLGKDKCFLSSFKTELAGNDADVRATLCPVLGPVRPMDVYADDERPLEPFRVSITGKGFRFVYEFSFPKRESRATKGGWYEEDDWHETYVSLRPGSRCLESVFVYAPGQSMRDISRISNEETLAANAFVLEKAAKAMELLYRKTEQAD